MATSSNVGILRTAMDARTFHPGAEQDAVARTEGRLRLLIDTGLLLSSERSLDVIVQAALDAGLALCGAAYGAFSYSSVGSDGEPYQLQKVSGIVPEAFGLYSTTKLAAVLPVFLDGEAILRSQDVTSDARFGREAPFAALLPGQATLRSYLVVPVKGRAGEVLGALQYGHAEPNVFQREMEPLVATVAAQAAVAIENLRLNRSLSQEIAVADAARARQRSADQRLRQALDAAQLGTWSWNAASGLIDLDSRAAELYGVPAHLPTPQEELRRRTVYREDLALAAEDLQQVLQRGGSYSTEYRVQLPDGSQRWLAVSGNASMDEGSREPVGMIGTVQDITLRKTQEASLRQSEKLAATGRLAATIAHEINNPLEAITNLIYLAKTDPATPSPICRLLETADGELSRVSQIAQQTLGFYRDTTRPVQIDLNDLLKAVVDLFSRKLAGKRLECTLDLEPGLSVVGLQGEIRQVVSNLLVNAIDASGSSGGEIRIRGRHRQRGEHRGVSVLISDQGTGIPHHVRHRLFKPFVTTKQSLGTGLGLWVTRGMIEKHGGTVCFRSRTDEPTGTVFRVYLPRSGASKLFASPSSAVLQ